MPIFIVFDSVSGRLHTAPFVDAAAPVVEAPLTTRLLAVKPRDDQMWDEATRDYVARPAKVLVDRVDDIVNDARISSILSARLNPTQLAALKTVIGEILGGERFRSTTHPPKIPG